MNSDIETRTAMMEHANEILKQIHNEMVSFRVNNLEKINNEIALVKELQSTVASFSQEAKHDAKLQLLNIINNAYKDTNSIKSRVSEIKAHIATGDN